MRAVNISDLKATRATALSKNESEQQSCTCCQPDVRRWKVWVFIGFTAIGR